MQNQLYKYYWLIDLIIHSLTVHNRLVVNYSVTCYFISLEIVAYLSSSEFAT